jgi:hypothetical protein
MASSSLYNWLNLVTENFLDVKGFAVLRCRWKKPSRVSRECDEVQIALVFRDISKATSNELASSTLSVPIALGLIHRRMNNDWVEDDRVLLVFSFEMREDVYADIMPLEKRDLANIRIAH